MAIVHENHKYYVCENPNKLSAFLDSIEEGDEKIEVEEKQNILMDQAYYMSKFLEDKHITEFLFSKNENIFTVINSARFGTNILGIWEEVQGKFARFEDLGNPCIGSLVE